MSHCVQDPVLTEDKQIQELITKAKAAQAKFESFSQEQVDAIVKGIGKYVYDNAEPLARMAVDETGIGVYEDKILKNKGKARVIWNNLKDKKSRGIIGEDAENNMVFVAKPMGVVAAVTPVTNPVVTPMCNVMFAVKTGNAVIFAPHPKAEKLTALLTREFMKIVKANGGPDDLIQTVQNGTIQTTQELMKVVDVVVATGGGAMVKSAYSSGKPSFGVGAGNVPVIVDNDVDLADAAIKIVNGASFDNGIICSHEQFVLVPEEKYRFALKSFEETGKVWFTEDEDPGAEVPRHRFPGRAPEQGCRREILPGDWRDDRDRHSRQMSGSFCCLPRAPARTTSWQRRSYARSSLFFLTRASRRPLRRPRRISLWKAQDTRLPSTPTTKPTFVKPVWNCRSAGWSSISRVPLLPADP